MLFASRVMKIFTILFIVLSGAASANEITLKKGKGYVVPDDKIWIIKDAPVAEGRVSTADVYIKGEFSNVQLNGVTFHGTFTFSFSNEINGEITMYPGTEIWLGDSRRILVVKEQKL